MMSLFILIKVMALRSNLGNQSLPS